MNFLGQQLKRTSEEIAMCLEVYSAAAKAFGVGLGALSSFAEERLSCH